MPFRTHQHQSLPSLRDAPRFLSQIGVRTETEVVTSNHQRAAESTHNSRTPAPTRPSGSAGYGESFEAEPAVEAAARALTHIYRMTLSEARVALLLAERYSNREIAQVRGVTEHTARRHTEKVLMKLQIHRRGEVKELVQSALSSIVYPHSAAEQPTL